MNKEAFANPAQFATVVACTSVTMLGYAAVIAASVYMMAVYLIG